MIRDFAATAHDMRCETCIVGSGPAGITLALELAARGLPSLVLESGGESAGGAQDLSDAEIVDPSAHDDMSIAVARRLGGASNLWGGRCMPLDPCDFEPRPFAQGARWPIGYDDIAPYYAQACPYATCGEPVFDAPMPGVDAISDDFAFETIERASNIPKMQKAHARALAASPLVDIRLDATVVDFDIAESGAIQAAIVASRDGRRRRVVADRFVIAAGGLESTRLLMIAQRRRPGMFGGADGPLGRYYMGHIIGEIADIFFRDERFDVAFDLLRDGHGSYTRRRFTPSLALQKAQGLPNICFWPVVPPIADPRHRSGALSAVALALSTPGLKDLLLPEAIRIRHVGPRVDWAPHLRNVMSDAPRMAAFLLRFAWRRYVASERIPAYFIRNRSMRYGLSYHCEQSPRADSRVTLSETADRLGAPRLRIDLRFAREDAEGVVRAHERLADWLRGSHIAEAHYRQPEAENVDAVVARMSHGTHQIGTARMGATRADGVVDRNLRCFDAPNLFVASSAVFHTSGQANPTLSIIAFAVRLAEHLAAESAMAPEVRRESAHAT
ncbi:MAG TPA: GMC family oxidoreductase [Rhodoblastus sp.]|nr:GMC family oxidoreductase [Rhodoblastus sp.]